MQPLSLIPDARRDAVETALRAAFGKQETGAFHPIRGGVSGASILRFSVRDRSYVLRIEPERVALTDRQRGFTCMTAAASVGAAPAVHHADPAEGIAIMDFISGRPLADYPGGPAALASALGALIATLQTAPLFPFVGNYPDAIANMVAGLRTSRVFAADDLNPHAEGLARIRAVLPWDEKTLVPSHNDPNPRNILFDGARLWLVDWELGFRNDRLVDLAILTTELAEGPDLEDALVMAALGHAPNDALRARLRVIRLLTRLFYGCVVLDSLADVFASAPDIGDAGHSPASFRAALAAGRLASGAPETAYAFGRMSLAAFVDGVASPDFGETLKRASEG